MRKKKGTQEPIGGMLHLLGDSREERIGTAAAICVLFGINIFGLINEAFVNIELYIKLLGALISAFLIAIWVAVNARHRKIIQAVEDAIDQSENNLTSKLQRILCKDNKGCAFFSRLDKTQMYDRLADEILKAKTRILDVSWGDPDSREVDPNFNDKRMTYIESIKEKLAKSDNVCYREIMLRSAFNAGTYKSRTTEYITIMLEKGHSTYQLLFHSLNSPHESDVRMPSFTIIDDHTLIIGAMNNEECLLTTETHTVNYFRQYFDNLSKSPATQLMYSNVAAEKIGDAVTRKQRVEEIIRLIEQCQTAA
jgi:hypothetical protein